MLTSCWRLFVFSLPFTDLLFLPDVLVGAGQPSTLFGLLLLAMLFLSNPQRAFRVLGNNTASRLFLALIAVTIASVFMSWFAPLNEWKGDVLWWKTIKQVLQLLIAFASFACPLLYIDSPGKLAESIRLYAAGMLVSVLYGSLEMLHYLGVETLGFSFLADIVHAGTFFGAADKPNLVFLPSLSGFPRLRLLASEPSMAGDYILSVLPLVAFCALGRGRLRWRVMLAAGVALLLLTFSVGSWVALGIAVPAALCMLLRYRAQASRLLLVVFIAAALSGPITMLSSNASGPLTVPLEVLGRLSRTDTDISVSGRMLENQTAWKLFLDYPVLGVGVGNWVFHYPTRMMDVPTTYVYLKKQVSESGFNRASGINNLFLRMLCETGIVGLGLFCAFIFTILRTAYDVARAHPSLASVGVALMTAALAVVIHFNSLSAFDKRYWWFVFGIVTAAGRLYVRREVPQRLSFTPAALGRMRPVCS